MACSQRNWIYFTKLYSMNNNNNNNNNNNIDSSTISIEVYSYHFYKVDTWSVHCVVHLLLLLLFFLKKTGIKKTNKIIEKTKHICLH
jgi:hypothetical protein